jgi:hypothetical protein
MTPDAERDERRNDQESEDGDDAGA